MKHAAYRVILLTASSPRHRYCIETVGSKLELCGVVQEPKGEYYSQARRNSPLIEEHFAMFARYENEYFGQSEIPESVDVLTLEDRVINSSRVVAWAKAHKPDIVLVFGTGILRDVWLSAFPERIVNLHLGLSPYYRGSATLFWPFVNRELECVGVTIHVLENQVDAGAILHRVKPELSPGDNYYTINCKAIRGGIQAFPRVAKGYLEGTIVPQPQLRVPIARIYRRADFTEGALRQVLQNVGRGLSKREIERIKTSDKCAF